MKWLTLSLSIFTLFSFCAREDKSASRIDKENNREISGMEITIEGELFRDNYFNIVSPQSSQFAYLINLTLTNTGYNKIVFDELEIMFLPESGTPLRQSLKLGKNSDNYQLDEVKTLELGVGESTSIPRISTDGYTDRLISDAENKPLMFSISIIYKGIKIAGPFRTKLPDIETLSNLPAFHQTLRDKNIKGYKLYF